MLVFWQAQQSGRRNSRLVAGITAAPNVCEKKDQVGVDEGVVTGFREGLKKNGCRCEFKEER